MKISGSGSGRRRETVKIYLIYVWLWLLSLFVTMQLVIYVKKYLYCANRRIPAGSRSSPPPPLVLLVRTVDESPDDYHDLKDLITSNLVVHSQTTSLTCTKDVGHLFKLVKTGDLTNALVTTNRIASDTSIKYVCMTDDLIQTTNILPIESVKHLLVSRNAKASHAVDQARPFNCLTTDKCMIVSYASLLSKSDTVAKELVKFLNI